MSVDFTAFDAQVAGTAGTAGSASGTIDGGDGGNAIDALPPYSNTDFSLEPSLNRVFPTTIGGNGGAGAGGANSTTTSLAVQGGLGGKGGPRSSPWRTIFSVPRRTTTPGPSRSRRPRTDCPAGWLEALEALEAEAGSVSP